MELIVTILCTISGALIGTTVGLLLMFRKFRPPSQTELDTLRGNLETAECSLAAATTDLDNLRKQIVERDRSIQESSQELNEKQRQLGFAIAEAEKAAAGLEEERTRVAEQARRQLASFEAQVDADKLQIQEVGGEVARLTAECAELKAQLGAELERSGQLAGQIAELQSDRQSAAKGIELLLMAQQNLSRFLKPVSEGGPNGNGGGVPVEAATADSLA